MDDVLEIRALIERQFASLSWPTEVPATGKHLAMTFWMTPRFIQPRGQFILKVSLPLSHG